MSFLQLVIKGDIVIQLVLLTLLAMSVCIWAILFRKNRVFRTDLAGMDKFEKQFWSGIMLEEFYEQNRSKLNGHMELMFASAMEEWITSQTNQSIAAVDAIKDGLRGRIISSLNQRLDSTYMTLSRGIGIVSTISSLAPFVGLFGTVWGIMNSFRLMTGASTVSLSTIAPGIAEALVTTAFGIFVSICAVLVYAKVDSELGKLMNRLSAFKSDLFAALSRELDNFSVQNLAHHTKPRAK